MQRFLTAFTAFALALSMLATAQAAPAAAAGEIVSDYFGESAFLNLAPGQAGQFAVGFNNVGTAGWQSGTATQVDLVICQADKLTCNTPSPNSAWASNWYSATAYATQSTSFVGPGQTGWFVYAVRAPGTATTGTTARFNGDLALHQTSAMIHQQGYYQDATVSASANPPTDLTLSPSFQGRQIGQTATVTANVTADPPTGSTTRQPVANQEVTFQVPANGLNPAITATSITDASGNASFSYTRNNPGLDQITAYVTGTPTVRDMASVAWGTSATTISVTPDDAATVANDDCRTYAIVAKDINGNDIIAGIVANALENNPQDTTSTDDEDGGVTFDGGSGATDVSGGTNEPIDTATTPGAGSLEICGDGTFEGDVTPIVWQDNTPADGYWTTTAELADAGGTTTFEARVPTITVTPDTAASLAAGAQRVFTVTAVDQFGDPYTGTVALSTVETTDNTVGTTSNAVVSWVDNDATLQTTGAAGCATAASGTTGVNAAYTNAFAVNATSGQLTFALCAPAAGSGTAVSYFEDPGGAAMVHETDEPGDTGGATTWAAAALTSCTLEITSGGAVNPGLTGNVDPTDASTGDVVLTFTYTDQAGNPIDPSTTASYNITFTTTNTGGSTTNTYEEDDWSGDSDTTLGGTSDTTTSTAFTGSATDFYITSPDATTATVSASSTVGSTTVSCGPVSLQWIEALTEDDITGSTAQGTIVYVDNGVADDDDIGMYIVQTTVGNFLITFDRGLGDQFFVTGTDTSGASLTGAFEGALSVGDVVKFTDGGDGDADTMADTHEIITNAP